jgi:hypothetical protein
VAIVDASAPGVISTSAIEAWIRPEATADHTDIDHVAANFRVIGTYLSDGNIRIYGVNNNDVIPPLEPQALVRAFVTSTTRPEVRLDRQNAPMLVGQYKVNWVWN